MRVMSGKRRWLVWLGAPALAAAVTSCAGSDENRFPAYMPMVTYYEAAPSGPMGDARSQAAALSQPELPWDRPPARDRRPRPPPDTSALQDELDEEREPS